MKDSEESNHLCIADRRQRVKDLLLFFSQASLENAKQDDIALKIDTALYTIEKNNPSLKGVLPDNYYSRLHIDTAKLASLLDEINLINTDE